MNRRHEMNMDRPLLLHQSFAQKWNVAETDVAWFLAETGWSGGKMIVNCADQPTNSPVWCDAAVASAYSSFLPISFEAVVSGLLRSLRLAGSVVSRQMFMLALPVRRSSPLGDL